MLSKHRNLIASLIFVLMVLGLLAIFATGGALWAAPNSQGCGPLGTDTCPPPFTNTTVITAQGATGTAASDTGSLSVTVPPGVAPIGSQLIISATISITTCQGVSMPIVAGTTIVSQPDLVSGATGNYLDTGHTFTVSLLGPDSVPITGPLSSPLVLTFPETGDDAARLATAQATNPAAAYVAMVFDPGTCKWTPLPTTLTVNPITGQKEAVANLANLPAGAVVSLFIRTL